jgi:hypothetical protein
MIIHARRLGPEALKALIIQMLDHGLADSLELGERGRIHNSGAQRA